MERFNTSFEQQNAELAANVGDPTGYPTLAASSAFIHVFLSKKFYH
jgi:hypothetical protein